MPPCRHLRADLSSMVDHRRVCCVKWRDGLRVQFFPWVGEHALVHRLGQAFREVHSTGRQRNRKPLKPLKYCSALRCPQERIL